MKTIANVSLCIAGVFMMVCLYMGFHHLNKARTHAANSN